MKHHRQQNDWRAFLYSNNLMVFLRTIGYASSRSTSISVPALLELDVVDGIVWILPLMLDEG